MRGEVPVLLGSLTSLALVMILSSMSVMFMHMATSYPKKSVITLRRMSKWRYVRARAECVCVRERESERKSEREKRVQAKQGYRGTQR